MAKGVRSILLCIAICLLSACDDQFVFDNTIDRAESAFSQFQFNDLCEQRAGLTINGSGAMGGVEATTPRVDEALWLLFDVGAPFVEMERTKWGGDEDVMRSWGPLAADREQLWRFDRKPAGDPSCAPFRAWLSSQETAKGISKVIHGRWLDPASYQGQCVKFTAAPLSKKTASGYEPNTIQYRLLEESVFIQRVGACGTVSQTNRALVAPPRHRLFQVRALRLSVAQGCLTSIDGHAYRSDMCGGPSEKNLFAGKTILIDTSSKAGKAKLETLEEECRLKATCQGTK